MWERTRLFDNFSSGFLQKLRRLIGIYNTNEISSGVILEKCPNLNLENEVSKDDKINYCLVVRGLSYIRQGLFLARLIFNQLLRPS